MDGARIDRLVLNRPDLRFPFPERLADHLTGATIAGLGRRAKYLLIHFDRPLVLISHLGMSGSYRIEMDGEDATPGEFHHARSKMAAHDHMVFHLTTAGGAKARVIYNDPRRFGFVALSDTAVLNDNPHLAGLGMEPTGNALDGQALATLIAGRNTPLKSTLLDQHLIAGLGNIYVCEALWRARLSPKRKAATLVRKDGKPTDRCHALADAVRAVIAEAIEAGGSSLRDHIQADGSLGYFQHRFAVYDRAGERCANPDCGHAVSRIVQSGRSTFYCSACQR